MSNNSFNKRARLDITVTISGGGGFWPFSEGYGLPVSWSVEGEIKAVEFEEQTTVKEDTCGVKYGVDKQFRSFGATGSTGGTSGTIKVGQYPNFSSAETLLGQPLGTWMVNTKPELEPNGKIEGEEAPSGYLVVLKPTDPKVKIDDPIIINPAIDNLSRVYPGDRVYTIGKGADRRWYVGPQKRYPNPKRTFFWVPNTEPVLKPNGIVDDELALPGTIMLPTRNFFIENPSDAINGMRYFYKNQGVIFDGQTWSKLAQDPTVYQPTEGPKQFRNLSVYYGSEDFFENRMEFDHWQKPFVFTNQKIDTQTPPKLTYQFEGEQQETLDMVFKWMQPLNGVATNIQPTAGVIYNFGDAWSAYHLNNREWLKTRFKGSTGAGFTLSTKMQETDLVLPLGVDDFIDGNVTEIKETYIDIDGNVLENNYTVTLTATPYIE